MDFARRVRCRAASDAGIVTNAEGITTSPEASDTLPSGNPVAHLRLLNSRRITFADENRLGHSRIAFNACVYVCAGSNNTDTRNHTAAEGLSRRVAELRRGNRDALTDFLGQQRLRARKDRWKNGRVLPESPHLIQARQRDAEDRRGRPMDA